MDSAPVFKGFEYRVRLAVSIPHAWAGFLRTVALDHYDTWCRESAKAGVVNGLRNTACGGTEFPSTYPVDWRDLDLLAKIMEQSHYHADTAEKRAIETAIDVWIRTSKVRIVAREQALARWSAEQVDET